MLLDKIINTVFSFGAAVVIFGAWGKLEHTDFGDTALTAGLLTETAIFCLYGLLEWIRRPASAADDTGKQAAVETGAARPGEHAGVGHRSVSPVHKEDLEALTGSIKETANLLAKIFRV
jgi:GldL N-terminal domain